MDWRVQCGAMGKTFRFLIPAVTWKASLNFLFCLKNGGVSNDLLTSCEDKVASVLTELCA